jgi:hypothetical protein
MGMFTPQPEQWVRLNALGSVPKYAWEENRCICMLEDVALKKVWHSGRGTTAQEAIEDALNTASPKGAPKSAAEIAEENMNQTQKIADLESKLENLKEGDGSSKPSRFMEDASIDSGRKKKKRRRSTRTSTDTETKTE